METLYGNKVISRYLGLKIVKPNFHKEWDEFMPAYRMFRSDAISPVKLEELPKYVIEKWQRLELAILDCDIRYAFELLVELINWKNNKS